MSYKKSSKSLRLDMANSSFPVKGKNTRASQKESERDGENELSWLRNFKICSESLALSLSSFSPSKEQRQKSILLLRVKSKSRSVENLPLNLRFADHPIFFSLLPLLHPKKSKLYFRRYISLPRVSGHLRHEKQKKRRRVRSVRGKSSCAQ